MRPILLFRQVLWRWLPQKAPALGTERHLLVVAKLIREAPFKLQAQRKGTRARGLSVGFDLRNLSRSPHWLASRSRDQDKKGFVDGRQSGQRGAEISCHFLVTIFLELFARFSGSIGVALSSVQMEAPSALKVDNGALGARRGA